MAGKGKGADSVTVFIVEGVASMRLVIPRKGRTAEETRVFQAARKALGDKVVEFRPQTNQVRRGSAVVADPVVAKAVRLMAKRPKEHWRIHEDLQLLKIRCPYCEFTLESNTQADQQKLADHIAFECEGYQAAAEAAAAADDADDAADEADA